MEGHALSWPPLNHCFTSDATERVPPNGTLLPLVASYDHTRYNLGMKVPGLRSPHDKVGKLVYFGRMLDKIKLHAQGKLPADYQPNLGTGFDGRCCSFLGVKYVDVVARVKSGDEDRDVLEWCLANGRKPSDDEVEIWNDYLRKRGWRDDASKRLVQRKQESGFANRNEIQAFFDHIDADEGRDVRTQF